MFRCLRGVPKILIELANVNRKFIENKSNIEIGAILGLLRKVVKCLQKSFQYA